MSKKDKPTVFYKIFDTVDQKYIPSRDIVRKDGQSSWRYNRKAMWKIKSQPFIELQAAIPNRYEVHSFILSYNAIESPTEYLKNKELRDKKKHARMLENKRAQLTGDE